MKLLLLPLFFCYPMLLLAQSDIQTPQGRASAWQQLELQRAAIHKKFDQAHADCLSKFAVNACQHEVKLQRNRALDPLVMQEKILKKTERIEAAQTQQKKIDDKVSEQALASKAQRREEAEQGYSKRELARAEKKAERDHRLSESKNKLTNELD